MTPSDGAAVSPGTPEGIAIASDVRIGAEVRALSQLNPMRTAVAIAIDWLAISGCFGLGAYLGSAWLWPPLAIVIASRQHALAILMHDGAHQRMLKNRRWNDRLSNWLCAYPILITTEGYRKSHLAHHNYLNTDRDPDWTRKRGLAEWVFPKGSRGVVLLLLKVGLGASTVQLLRRAKAYGTRNDDRAGGSAKDRTSAMPRVVYYGTVAALLTITGGWALFLLYWILPLFTLTPVLLRIRSIAEHFGMPWTGELDMSRSTEPALWERLIVAPHSIHYHLEHHLFPSVPFYNVPALRRILLSHAEFARRAHVSKTYFGATRTSVFRDITGRRG